MKKIKNLSELDQRIHQLREKEREDKKVLKEGVSQARHASEQIELAFYIGKIASEIFRAWKKPKSNNAARWKNVIISVLMIAGIHLAQRYLDGAFNDSKED